MAQGEGSAITGPSSDCCARLGAVETLWDSTDHRRLKLDARTIVKLEEPYHPKSVAGTREGPGTRDARRWIERMLLRGRRQG